MALLSVGLAFPHFWTRVIPSPCLPVQGVPMMSLSLRFPSARASDAETSHFHTDLVLIPASRTLLSLESLKVITTLHFATLNSSTRDERGSCSCPDLTYSPTDVKLVGIPSHFRRYSLILHSTPSTAVSGISYTVNSYISLGSRPCWYIQALNFPGSPDFSMFFSQPSACFSVLWTLLLSRSDSSYHFPRCIMGLSFIDGLISPCMTEFVSDVAFLNNHTP